MSSFADVFLQVDMSNAGGSPGVLGLNKRSDVAKPIADAGQDASGGDVDDVEGVQAKRKDSAEQPEVLNEGDKDQGDKNRAYTGSAEMLPETVIHTHSDGDVVMNDDGLRGNAHGTTSSSPPASSPASVNATPASTSPIDATPASTSGDDSSPAPSSEPPLSITPASSASARSSTQVLHPSDEGAPAFLSSATLAHLRGASPAEAWQNLITTFLCFERANPPTGVCFYSADFAY